MKYMIVTASSPKSLEIKVQELMDKHGWEPLGAHAVATWEDEDSMACVQCFEYSQVLINQSE